MHEDQQRWPLTGRRLCVRVGRRDFYIQALRYQLRWHPNCERIVQAVIAGQVSRAELDEAYAEAERYAWEEIGRRLPPVNPDGTVTFPKVVRRN